MPSALEFFSITHGFDFYLSITALHYPKIKREFFLKNIQLLLDYKKVNRIKFKFGKHNLSWCQKPWFYLDIILYHENIIVVWLSLVSFKYVQHIWSLLFIIRIINTITPTSSYVVILI